MISRWFPYNEQLDKGKPMLFCFHYAGGTASAFFEWKKAIKNANIVPVELPGKGTRYKEVFLKRIEDILQRLCEEILPLIRGHTFYFYGHSMGAAIAFYTGMYLQKNKGIVPEKFIVSGRQAPQDLSVDEGIGYLSDEEIKKELERVGGTPDEILSNEDIMKFFMPAIRADYCLNDSFSYEGEKINCPIIANCGHKDEDASLDIMNGWRAVTSKEFVIREFEGDHFFPFHNSTYLNYIDGLL